MAVAMLDKANGRGTPRDSTHALGPSLPRKDCSNSDDLLEPLHERESDRTGATAEQECEFYQRLVGRQAASSPGQSVTYLFSLRDDFCELVDRTDSPDNPAIIKRSSKKRSGRQNERQMRRFDANGIEQALEEALQETLPHPCAKSPSVWGMIPHMCTNASHSCVQLSLSDVRWTKKKEQEYQAAKGSG